MNKYSTKVFKYSSILFGVLGVTIALTGLEPGGPSNLEQVLGKVFLADIFVILSSFALSVAEKYLS